MNRLNSQPYGLPTTSRIGPIGNNRMNKPIYIYVLIDPSTNKARYVGKTDNLKRRYSCHLANAKLKDSHLTRWVHKLMRSGKKPIMRVLEIADDQNWQSREQFWINTLRKQGVSLVNTADGGKGGSGKHTPQAKQKISQRFKGGKLSRQHREKLRQSKKELFASERGTELSRQYSREYGVLTDAQVIEVWRLAHEGILSNEKIGRMYGIPQSSVSEIKTGKRYKHVPRPTVERPDPNLLSICEAARRMGENHQRLMRYIKRHKIPTIRRGRDRLVDVRLLPEKLPPKWADD